MAEDSDDLVEVTDVSMLPGLDEIETPMTALVDVSPHVQALVEELKALHTDQAAPFDPTCLCKERNHADDAACIKALFKNLYYDSGFLNKLIDPPKTASDAILRAANASCNDIKHDLDAYQESTLFDAEASTKALIFYRRHSFPLKAHITTDEADFFDSMCAFLACILRKAGYTVNGPQ
jgi:hypothetical protein